MAQSTESIRKEFLYQSILDIQSTIRALDVKAGFMFVICIIPISSLKDIASAVDLLITASSIYGWPILASILFWILSITTLLRSIVSISNPNSCIKGNTPAGSFYLENEFSFSLIDTLFNFPIKSKSTIDDVILLTPANQDQLEQQLVYEKLKLTYIRDIKSARTSACIIYTVLWITLSTITTITHKTLGIL